MAAPWILNLESSFEPSLSLRFRDYMNEVGHFLNVGADYLAFDAADLARVDMAVQSGLRRAYAAHDWSFLEPATTLTTVAGTGAYDAPAEFGGTIYGDMTFADDSGSYHAVILVSEGQIVKNWQDSTSTGRPMLCATRYKSSTGSAGQRHEILLDPIPDAVYALTYVYPALKNKLTANNPYPLGGMIHSEMFMEACLAAAELLDDNEIGIHEARYREALERSKARDNDIRTPGTMGFNRDGGPGLLRPVRVKVARHNGLLSTVR